MRLEFDKYSNSSHKFKLLGTNYEEQEKQLSLFGEPKRIVADFSVYSRLNSNSNEVSR